FFLPHPFQVEQIVQQFRNGLRVATPAGCLKMKYRILQYLLHERPAHFVETGCLSRRGILEITRQFFPANLFEGILKLLNGGANDHLPGPILKLVQRFPNNFLHSRDGRLATVYRLLRLLRNLIQVVKYHAWDVLQRRVNTPRHREIDKELMRHQVASQQVRGDEGTGSRYGTYNDVCLAYLLGQHVKTSVTEAALLSELAGPLWGTIEYRNLLRIQILVYKIANDILADFSDAKHEYLRPTVSTRELLYHFCSCVGKRCGTIAEGRFLHHALVGEEDGVHQPVEKRSGHIHISAPLVGALHLSAHLNVANDLGVQAYRHVEQVPNGCFAFQVDKISISLLDGDAFDQPQAVEELSAVIPFSLIINLRPVAG